MIFDPATLAALLIAIVVFAIAGLLLAASSLAESREMDRIIAEYGR